MKLQAIRATKRSAALGGRGEVQAAALRVGLRERCGKAVRRLSSLELTNVVILTLRAASSSSTLRFTSMLRAARYRYP